MAYQSFAQAVYSFQCLEEWKENQKQLLVELKNSGINFELTGSRYFTALTTTNKSKDKINIFTDYDFFTECTEEVEVFLESKGFLNVRDSVYKEDNNCVKVYSHSDLNIQVQLVQNLERKREIQEILSKLGDDFIDLDKESRKLVWQSFSRSMNFDVHLSKKRKEIDEQKKDLEEQIHQFNKLKIVLDLLKL